MSTLLSRQSDYALQAVRHLAHLPKGQLGSIEGISEAERLPRHFLARILKLLSKYGILKSYRGVLGGFTLARHPRNISFLDVIEALDGPIRISQCTQPGRCPCRKQGDTYLHGFWATQEQALKKVLKNKKFA